MNRIQILLLFVCVSFAGCSKISNIIKSETIVNGEVFIVTQGADNIELGAVEVVAIPAETFESNFQTEKSDIKLAIDKDEEVLKKCQNFKKDMMENPTTFNQTQEMLRECSEEGTLGKGRDLPGLIVSNIPSNAVLTTTNSDGKFTLNLPKGKKYAIYAKSQRRVGSKNEKYFWLEFVEAKDKTQNLILTNKNLLTTDHLKLLVQ